MRVRWNGQPTDPAFLEKNGIRFPKGQWVMRPERERDKYEHDGTFEVDQLSAPVVRKPDPETTKAPVTPIPNDVKDPRATKEAEPKADDSKAASKPTETKPAPKATAPVTASAGGKK